MATDASDPVNQDLLLRKTQAIVTFLDKDRNGYMDASEVKVFISKLTGVPVAEIPDNHPEVRALSGITAEALAQRLVEYTDASILEGYFEELGLPLDGPQPGGEPRAGDADSRGESEVVEFEQIDEAFTVVFEQFDLNTDGKISIEECLGVTKAMCEVSGQEYSEQEGRQKFQGADLDKSGRLSLGEFKAAVLKDLDWASPAQVQDFLGTLNRALPVVIGKLKNTIIPREPERANHQLCGQWVHRLDSHGHPLLYRRHLEFIPVRMEKPREAMERTQSSGGQKHWGLMRIMSSAGRTRSFSNATT